MLVLCRPPVFLCGRPYVHVLSLRAKHFPLTANRKAYKQSTIAAMSAPLRNRIDMRDAGSFKISSAEREVRRAIEELKDSEKSAYMEALERAPDLVAAESRVDRFLRREKSNVIAAAKLQALYWKDRKAFFGDRAFLPLDDLTGNGALTTDDIEALSQGFMVRIPDDKGGRPSLLIDISRIGKSHINGLTRLHCLFYWLSIQIAQNPKAQTEGFNMIRIISETSLDRNILMKLIKVIQSSLPVKIYSSHICVLPPAGDRQRHLENLMPVLVELTSNIKATRNKIHSTEDRQEIIRELEADGIPSSSLPYILGGSWGYDSFDAWFDLQRKGTNLELACAAAAVNDGDEKLPAIDDSLVEASRVARAEERKERKRQLDVIYARKRREREKEDTESLQEQCYRLNQANVALKEQGEKLERLLGEARRMVEVLEVTQVNQRQPAPQAYASSTNQAATNSFGNTDQSDAERQLLQHLLLAALPRSNQATVATASSAPEPQTQPASCSPTSEVLLQLLTLSSKNSNTTSNPNNVIAALQQVTPALALLQSNRQSQEVLTNILCQVVALLEQQNQPQQIASSNITTKLIQLLPLIQQLQSQQLQAQQIPSQQMQSQHWQAQQMHTQQVTQQQPVQQQPVSQPQSVPIDPNQIQEQLLRLLRNAGLR